MLAGPSLAALDDAPWRGLALTEALERLRVEAGLRLVYSEALVPPTMRVRAEPTASDPREVLDELLAPHGLVARDGPGGTILVTRAARAHTGLRGRVASVHGRRIPAARIVVVGAAETRCDREGRFELELTPGVYTVIVTAPGFVTRTFRGFRIPAGRPLEVDWSLEFLEFVHESIQVTGAAGAPAEQATADQIGLERRWLDLAPSLVDDPAEVVARLPGVAEPETSVALNVRGGRGDEVLIIVDGLELHRPYHVRDLSGGLLTLLDSTTLERIDYFGGAFPAQYGNRLSAVLDMTTTTTESGTEGSLTLARGLFRAQGRGSFGADADGNSRGDWLVSGRIGDPEFLLESYVPENIYSPYYADLVGKVSWRVGRRTVVSANVLFGLDSTEDAVTLDEVVDEPAELEEARVDSRYASGYAWVRADTVWSADLLSRTMVAWGATDADRKVLDGNLLVAVHDQRDFSFLQLKQGWRAILSRRHQMRFGFDLRWGEATYDYRSLLGTSTTRRTADPSGLVYALYVSDTFQVHRTLLLELGLRYDGETYTGLDGKVTSPRANLAWSVGPRTTLRAGWGRYHQFQRIYELQIEDGQVTFSGVETAEHRQVGVEHQFGRALRGRASLFEKSQHGVRPWYENLLDPLVFVPELRADRVEVVSTRALSRGLETTLQGATRFGLEWSASYSLTHVEDTVEGRKEPRLWDQRHALDVGLRYRPGKHWELGLAGVWHSGRPTTASYPGRAAAPNGMPIVIPLLGPRNAERYEDYARVDVRAAYVLRPGASRVRLFANVANVFDAANPCCTRGFESVESPDGSVRLEPIERRGLGRTFTVGVTWLFGSAVRKSAQPPPAKSATATPAR